MCGIAGIVSKNAGDELLSSIKAATTTLQHRGPEGEGFWTNTERTVSFGHRRLRIIDLSDGGAQPMHYADRYTIIYNGEIYNYVELKKELHAAGCSFGSDSDTEVILAAYAMWGAACLQRFDGMFAFAIWDQKNQTIFAARDRFGEKPFFFSYDGQRFCFASEIKALWPMGIGKEVNKSMLYNFLTIGYATNPSDAAETFYNNIRKLPAAHYLTYSPAQHELVIHGYWKIYTEVNHTISERDAAVYFDELFRDSVRKRLRSDVAIGTSLSGGLDSSAIVAFCAGEAAAQYTHNCFTASFPGFDKDETRYAALVAKHFSLTHHTTAIAQEEVALLMEKIAVFQDEPFSSASVLAQYKVFQLAKETGVTVLLDGQGADEILGGYSKYYKWWWQELYRAKNLGRSGELKAAGAFGIKEKFGLKNKMAALLPELAASLLQSQKSKDAFRHPDLNRDFAFSNKRNLYYATPTTFDLNGALYYNTFVNGLEELLRLADRNSMANSVEVRLPFLQHELVEFLFTLPPHFKIHQGWTKWLLRIAVDARLPKEITWRKDKTGYEPPQKEWMKHAVVQERIGEAKKKLVQEEILQATVLKKPIVPKSAHENDSFDWRYWSAAQLFS